MRLVEQRLAEATLRALWQARRNLELTVEAGRTAPDLFVSRASIFSVFSEETRDEAGATLFFQPLRPLRLWGDGYVISNESGVGGRGGLRASVAAEPVTQIGAECRVLALPDSRYVDGRLWATRRFGTAVAVSLDGDATFLHPGINGQDQSLTLAGTVGWDFMPGWKAQATALVGRTPLVESRFEAMAKLVYSFNYHVQKVTP
jgi:hypothetical protein